MDRTNHSRPSLRSLCLEHKVTIFELEKASNVNYVSIWSVFIGLDSNRHVVERLLHGLNELRGTHYTLKDISVKLSEERLFVF